MKNPKRGMAGATARRPIRKAKTALDSASSAAHALQLPPDHYSGNDSPQSLSDSRRRLQAVLALYLRRPVRSIILRLALRGRLSWHVALPLLAWVGGGVQ
ncbi:hypothetical protein [Ideonella sp.]|uniref:hypothetical protein n=1 Tax=Ideonella sp. TaxID=1929293 RepID=UPI003BB7D1D6